MAHRWFGSVRAVVVAGTLMAPQYVDGQTSTSGEKPWDPPRTRDGQPDIQGYWSQRSDITTYSIQAGFVDREEHTRIGGQNPQKGRPVIDPPNGLIPYQPWAAKQAQFHYDQHKKPSRPEYLDPVSRCFEEGVPRMNYQGNMRVLQFPNYIVILHEFGHHYRVIYLDGRPHIGETLKLWMGDSRGRWEGNTLVVDVTNHNDKTWFDIVGSFHSDAMRVTERWTFTGPDRIDYVATIDDPKVFTQPWKLHVQMGRNKPEEQWESAICEGNKAVYVAFGLPW
ncbi:MAG: hypothetical protein ACRD3C_16295 [Vicinamibacterales bacterium]